MMKVIINTRELTPELREELVGLWVRILRAEVEQQQVTGEALANLSRSNLERRCELERRARELTRQAFAQVTAALKTLDSDDSPTGDRS